VTPSGSRNFFDASFVLYATYEETTTAEGNSRGTGVLVGALIVIIIVGGGLEFATGMIGHGGGGTATLKVQVPKPVTTGGGSK